MPGPSYAAECLPASTGALSAFSGTGGSEMNWDTVEGNWKQMTGKMREKWGKLTDDDWKAIGGKKDQFLGKLQERYGYSRDQAESDYNEWEKANQRTSKVA
jgi:uncharacterized protein YjbJ (UPF0337 family)